MSSLAITKDEFEQLPWQKIKWAGSCNAQPCIWNIWVCLHPRQPSYFIWAGVACLDLDGNPRPPSFTMGTIGSFKENDSYKLDGSFYIHGLWEEGFQKAAESLLIKEELSNAPPSIEQWKKQGLCPKCGSEGQWIHMSLCCSTHGPYAGC